jgi:hypothetical protein
VAGLTDQSRTGVSRVCNNPRWALHLYLRKCTAVHQLVPGQLTEKSAFPKHKKAACSNVPTSLYPAREKVSPKYELDELSFGFIVPT